MDEEFVFPPLPQSVTDKSSVHYTADTGKTDAEKTQARTNIGAMASNNPTATGTFTLGSTSLTEAQLQALLALLNP